METEGKVRCSYGINSESQCCRPGKMGISNNWGLVPFMRVFYDCRDAPTSARIFCHEHGIVEMVMLCAALVRPDEDENETTGRTEYEYGIGRCRDPEALSDPHRTGLTLREAQDWIKECDEAGIRPSVFAVIRRPIGRWEWDYVSSKGKNETNEKDMK